MDANGKRPIRVFIGVPCYGDVSPELLRDWMSWLYHCGRRLPQYEFFTGIKTKSEQFRARNAVVEGAMQVGADWLLMIDDDMVINIQEMTGPNGSYDLVDKLIRHNKDICGVLYYQKEGECCPVLMKRGTERGYRFLRQDEVEGRLQQVDVAGGGCLMIRMSIFDRLKQPHFAPEFEYGTDIQLCRAAQEAGFMVWADTSIELGHLRVGRQIVTSRNKHLFQTADMIPGEVRAKFVAADMYSSLIEDGLEYTGYKSLEEMHHVGSEFLKRWSGEETKDLDSWYARFPKERVARQVVFNSQNANKRQMTEYIVCAVKHTSPLRILDYGSGIGVTAFELARLGHRVTAVDLEGTETLQFLKWRCMKHKVAMEFSTVRTDQPAVLTGTFDVVVAMDVLEHALEWRSLLQLFHKHMHLDSFLFANNAIMEDNMHPEHLFVDPKVFLQACVELDIMPVNQLTYVKKENKHGSYTDTLQRVAVREPAGRNN